MFTFKISDYIQQDADKQRGVELQISQALEVYEKIKSRKQLPNLWNRIDVLNEKCILEEVLENREKRYKQYGVILIGLGSLCILLGDGTAQSLIFSLIIGGISIVLGCIYIKGKRKEPAKRIQKAAYRKHAEGKSTKWRSARNCIFKRRYFTRKGNVHRL